MLDFGLEEEDVSEGSVSCLPSPVSCLPNGLSSELMSQRIFETFSTFTSTSLSLLIGASEIDFGFWMMDFELEESF